MSFYPIFDEQEPTITSTTTAVNAALDYLLVHSAVTARKGKTYAGSIAYAPVTTLTVTSSATLIPNSGIAICQPVAPVSTAVAYLLSTPTAPTQSITIHQASSTSTAFYVTTNNTATALIYVAGGTGTGSVTLEFQLPYTTATLVSDANGAWRVTAKSTSVVST